jgi:ABC-2 type transport system permease protein
MKIMPGLWPLFLRAIRTWAANPAQASLYVVVPLVLSTIALLLWNRSFSILVEIVAVEQGGAPLSPAQQIIPGLTIVFLMMAMGTLAMRISIERETGAWRCLLVTPVRRPALPLSWALAAYVLLAFGPLAVLFIYGRIVFGMEIGNYTVFLVLAVFAWVPVGFGLLFANLTTNQSLQQQFAILVAVLLAAVGGGMIPAALFPEWGKVVAQLTPHYWFLDSVHGLMTADKNLLDVIPALLLIAAYGLQLSDLLSCIDGAIFRGRKGGEEITIK